MKTTTVKNGFMVEQDDYIHVFETPQSLADFVLKWAEGQEIEGSKKTERNEAAANDGWIDWDGKGPMPVRGSQMVEFEMRSGTRRRDEAGGLIWAWLSSDSKASGDIIKYRVIKG